MFHHYSLENSRCHTAWVGGLDRNTSKKDIMEFFQVYQPVQCKIINKPGQNPFSFVYFPTEALRDAAIMGKKGCLLKGNPVVVNRSFNAYEGTFLGGKSKVDPITGRETKY